MPREPSEALSHSLGNAPDLLNKESFYPGFDIVRDFAILPDNSGVVALDGYGATLLLPFAGAGKMNLAEALNDIDRSLLPPWTPGVDQYQALVAASDSMGFWVLDESGRIYGVGSALPAGSNEALLFDLGLNLTPQPQIGVNGAVDFAVLQNGEGVKAIIVLTSYGEQIVVTGDPTELGIQVVNGRVTGPGPATGSWNVDAPYFGWNIARDIDLEPTGKGYMVLDGFGGIHPLGDARIAWDGFIVGPRPGVPAEYGGHAYFGWDIARRIAYTPDGLGLVMLDGFGGTHYDGNIIPITEIYFGFDIARDIEITN